LFTHTVALLPLTNHPTVPLRRSASGRLCWKTRACEQSEALIHSGIGVKRMIGKRQVDQAALFYEFSTSSTQSVKSWPRRSSTPYLL